MGDENKGVGTVGGVVAALGLALVKLGGACSHTAAPLAEVGARAGSQAARIAGEGALLGTGARVLSKGATLEAGEHVVVAGARAAEDSSHATGALGALRSGEHGAEDMSHLAAVHVGGSTEHSSRAWESLIEQAPDLVSNAMDLAGDDDSPQPASGGQSRDPNQLHDPLMFTPGGSFKDGAPVTAEQNRQRIATLAPQHLPLGVIGASHSPGTLFVPKGEGLSEAALYQACLGAGGRCMVLACDPASPGSLARAVKLWEESVGTSRTYGELAWRLAGRLAEPAGQGVTLSYVLPGERTLRHVQAKPTKAR